MYFNSTVKDVGEFFSQFTDKQIKDEPMFFGADFEYAYDNGGPITRAFLECVPSNWWITGMIFDSRSHMLMEGWYPCIPGWHHDDVPRSTPTGQPNYTNPEYKAEHLLGLVNAHICSTEFLVRQIDVADPDINTTIYEGWDKQISEFSCKNIVNAESGRYYQFDWNTFHQGVPAVANGWRWFGRLSRKTKRPVLNEIRKQVQVYLEYPKAGW